MDVHLSSDGIHYLSKENIQTFANLTFYSVTKEAVQMNPLVLAALRSSLMQSLSNDYEESCVITEFTTSELEELNKFSWTGQCDLLKICDVIRALGIDVNNLCQPNNNAVNNVKIEVKEESDDMEFFNDDDFIDDEDEDDEEKKEDDDWLMPKKPKLRKRRRLDKATRVSLSKEQKELYEKYELPKPIEFFRVSTIESRFKHSNRVIDYSKEFSCELCQARFSGSQNLQEHITKIHCDHYDCMYCKRSFKVDEPEKFKLHMFKHEHNLLTSTASTCTQCGKYFRFSSHYQEHIKSRGPYHDDECAQCSKKLHSYEDYKKHVKEEHFDIWKFKCGHCKETFDDLTNLKNHKSFAHKTKVKKQSNEGAPKKSVAPVEKVCEECGKHVRDLNGHVTQVHRDFKLPCPHCSHLSKNKYALKRHIEWFHDEIPCDICGVMIGKRRMPEHVSSKHTSIYDRKFKCDVCGKGFSDNNKLREHKNVHTGEKPFKCKFCHASFASRGTKAMHERGHLGHKRK